MENIFSNIKERILYVPELIGITKEKFFEIIGVTYGNFKGKNKSTPISSDTLERLLTNFPDISPLWLLSGALPILTTINKTPGDAIEFNPPIINSKTDNMNNEIIKSLIRVIDRQEEDIRYALETQRELVMRIPYLGEMKKKRNAPTQ